MGPHCPSCACSLCAGGPRRFLMVCAGARDLKCASFSVCLCVYVRFHSIVGLRRVLQDIRRRSRRSYNRRRPRPHRCFLGFIAAALLLAALVSSDSSPLPPPPPPLSPRPRSSPPPPPPPSIPPLASKSRSTRQEPWALLLKASPGSLCHSSTPSCHTSSSNRSRGRCC